MSRLFPAGLQWDDRSRLLAIPYSASLSAAAYLGASVHMKEGRQYTTRHEGVKEENILLE